MKGIENHIGLEEKEIRDFLSKSLNDSYQQEYSFRRNPVFADTPQEREIKRLEQEIIVNNKLIEIQKNRLAIIQIMKSKSWKEHDISDYIQQESDGGYLSFIGNEDEYGNILTKISEPQD
jgi:hypothetical protein